jgi:HEAT repeat protein
LHGRLLVGVINSIGVRQDAGAISILTRKLKDDDVAVASAAAVSLGKIGGPKAAKVLDRYLAKAPEPVRPAVAEGCVRCAEKFLASEDRKDAVKLYDVVWHATLPKERVLEGLRGAILARGSSGIPILLAQLESTNRDFFNLGLRVARELPGEDATDAIAGEFHRAPTERQPLILSALGDRNDATAMMVVKVAARNAEKKVRLVAIDVLDRVGDSSALPTLLDDAANEDQDISQASIDAITRMGGNSVDAQIVDQLPNSSGRMRQALITLAAKRGIEKALPQIVQSVGDADADIRTAAIQALTFLGGESEVAELARTLEKTEKASDRGHIEKVLVTLSGRAGAKAVPSLVSLAHSDKPENRKSALQALVAAGGSDALAAIVAAIDDADASVGDAAVRTLCKWPNAWPEDAAVSEPLLRVAKAGSNSPNATLAVRGYLQFLLGDEKLAENDKLAKVQLVMPLLQRPEEKVTAMAVLQGIPDPAALEFLSGFASDPAIADDACAALVQVAAQKQAAISADQRKTALLLAEQKSTKPETKEKAEAMLKSLQ